jgi:uncharacterized membrane protein HdeD (DUF308 family)
MKSIAKIILAIAVVVAVSGIAQINDNLETRVASCDPMFSADLKSGERCVRYALEVHNEKVNRGWGITIVSSVVALIAFAYACADGNKNSTPKKP